MIEIHSKLSGRYIITKPIGSGGMPMFIWQEI